MLTELVNHNKKLKEITKNLAQLEVVLNQIKDLEANKKELEEPIKKFLQEEHDKLPVDKKENLYVSTDDLMYYIYTKTTTSTDTKTMYKDFGITEDVLTKYQTKKISTVVSNTSGEVKQEIVEKSLNRK